MLGCKGMHIRGDRHAGHTGGALERAGVRAGGVWRAACARTGVWLAGVRADGRLARGRAGCAGVWLRVRRRVYCSPESTSFTRNHLNDLK
ncbi:hypothetical protein CDL15_Pgr008070 [Punica granatum]|uniref:Uncharacterized protein n=1 Tax=Punica granatum TaxID=22663 RepID=A0A218WNI1_PUNGR|nr:hypothetical protein CDL15_Pgr008070 [Punica granatum]